MTLFFSEFSIMFLQPTKGHLQMNKFWQHKYSVLETWETNPMEWTLMLSKLKAEVKLSSVMDQLFLCCIEQQLIHGTSSTGGQCQRALWAKQHIGDQE